MIEPSWDSIKHCLKDVVRNAQKASETLTRWGFHHLQVRKKNIIVIVSKQTRVFKFVGQNIPTLTPKTLSTLLISATIFYFLIQVYEIREQ